MAGKKNLLTRKATYIQFNKIIGAWVYEQTSGAGISIRYRIMCGNEFENGPVEKI